ncbi:MAG TPA: hypothetical protein VES01_01065 [Dermatophilaceae bacterium]|nr:hypothetical protein [Dermatophilaceae bacterium]
MTSAPSSASVTSVTSSRTTPVTRPPSATMPARLPRNNSAYSQLLIDAWGRGDRTGAARVATPAAVAATFAHAPIRELINYSCEDGKPVICGYIGENDVRVEVSVDQAKVARGADQAITRVRLAMP